MNIDHTPYIWLKYLRASLSASLEYLSITLAQPTRTTPTPPYLQIIGDQILPLPQVIAVFKDLETESTLSTSFCLPPPHLAQLTRRHHHCFL
jgi:hypothetical protein